MARFETFDRDIRIATADLEPLAISAALAKYARQELAEVISTGQGSERYDKFVNGRQGATEESVRAPGPILYEFIHWPRIIQIALAELVKRSPKRSGRYASSFVVLADSRPVTNYATIPADAEVIITNVQPYARKIEVGAMRMSVPPRLFDQAKAALSRSFGANAGFRFESRFINLPGGIHPLAPYEVRRGRNAGRAMTYPAIVINAV